jgi:hypothetical protein
VDENRVGDRHPVVGEYLTGSGSALETEATGWVRSSWISGPHLGTKSRTANTLLDFLCSHYAEILYLVGDMVDGWNSGRYWCWGPAQNAAAREIVNWGWRNARVRFKLDSRSLRTYLKRFLSKAASRLTITRFSEVRL